MEDSNKYQNGKIYKIVDIGYNKCYYGSTVQLLSMRMAEHRRKYRVYEQSKIRVSVFDIFDEYGTDNCKIELVEAFPCNSKSELFSREGYYIKNNECVNKNVAGRGRKQYREDNKEYKKEQDKQIYNNNKEAILEQKKQYYENHKERILDQKKEMHTCSVCGSCTRRGDKAKHERSQKHQQALTKPDELENYDETII